jgi:hypothetical protein
MVTIRDGPRAQSIIERDQNFALAYQIGWPCSLAPKHGSNSQLRHAISAALPRSLASVPKLWLPVHAPPPSGRRWRW